MTENDVEVKMKKLVCVIAVITVLAVSLCACGQSAKPLSEIFEQLKTDYNVTDLVEFKSTDDLARYGIKAEDVKEYAGGINKSGVDQEEIVMVLATDTAAVGRVQAALNNRLESKKNETKNYNPEQYAIIENCTVEVDGNYVALIISKNADAMKADYKKAIGVS